MGFPDELQTALRHLLASGVLAERASAGLDPDAVAVGLALGDKLFAGLERLSIWDLALDLDRRAAIAPTGLAASRASFAGFR